MVLDANGGYLAEWGAPGVGSGEFSAPDWIAVSGQDVSAADPDGHRIQKFRLLPPLT